MWRRNPYYRKGGKDRSRKRGIWNHHPPGQDPDGYPLDDGRHHDLAGAGHIKEAGGVNNEQTEKDTDLPAPFSGTLRHAGDRNGKEGALHLSAASPSALSMQSVCFRYDHAPHSHHSHSETAVPFLPKPISP